MVVVVEGAPVVPVAGEDVDAEGVPEIGELGAGGGRARGAGAAALRPRSSDPGGWNQGGRSASGSASGSAPGSHSYR
jgi:hypothetical protein